MAETELMQSIRQALSRGACRIFRCNVGTGWAGGGGERRATRATPETLAALRRELRVGDVVVPAARPLHAGLQRGNGDLIGWQRIRITPDMVEREVAVFVSLEVKVPGRAPTPHQRNWRQQVAAAGGIAAVVSSVEEAVKFCNDWRPKLGQGGDS